MDIDVIERVNHNALVAIRQQGWRIPRGALPVYLPQVRRAPWGKLRR